MEFPLYLIAVAILIAGELSEGFNWQNFTPRVSCFGLTKQKTSGSEITRLPKRIFPFNYDLLIAPNLDALTFEGNVRIDLAIDKKQVSQRSQVSANKIVLHADESLKIFNVWYQDFGFEDPNGEKSANGAGNQQGKKVQKTIEVLEVGHDEKQQLLIIKLANKLRSGSRGRLHITFRGLLNTNAAGLYRTKLPEGPYMALTRFEPNEARKAFPCFDEPNFKATFDLTLLAPSNRVVLAGTEVISERTLRSQVAPRDEIIERTMIHYQRTPPISTSSLGFAVVGEYEHLGNELNLPNGRLKVNVWTQFSLVGQGEFALKMASAALEPMDKYYAIDNWLSKLDLVAVSGLEPEGATVSWGLITFPENEIFLDELISSPHEKARVTRKIVHKLARHWFGNLVTIDGWLEEGFANLMEYKISQDIYPEYEFKYVYLNESLIWALNRDTSRARRPVIGSGEHSEEWRQVIGKKVTAILRVLHEDFLTPENFRDAIKFFLRAHKFKHTSHLDLWSTMERFKQPNFPPVSQFIESWLTQPGFPLVHVSFDRGSHELVFKQQRFIVDAAAELTQDELKQRWMIPISVLVRGDGGREQLIKIIWDPAAGLTGDQGELKRVKLPDWFEFTEKQKGSNWLKVNVNFSDYYRADYSWELMELLREPIRERQMVPEDRLNILDDVIAMKEASRIGETRYAELLSWFTQENNSFVLERLELARQGRL